MCPANTQTGFVTTVKCPSASVTYRLCFYVMFTKAREPLVPFWVSSCWTMSHIKPYNNVEYIINLFMKPLHSPCIPYKEGFCCWNEVFFLFLLLPTVEAKARHWGIPQTWHAFSPKCDLRIVTLLLNQQCDATNLMFSLVQWNHEAKNAKHVLHIFSSAPALTSEALNRIV